MHNKTKGSPLKQVNKFKYLGTMITADGRCETEIKSRIAQSKAAFQKMKTILCNKALSLQLRKDLIKCYIEPILLYGCETWTINARERDSLMATEMWFLRRMLKIPWTAKKTNEDVLREANSQRTIIKKIRARQMSFIGHAMRRGKIENIITTGKIEGNKARGRPRTKMLDWMNNKFDLSTNEILDRTRDRLLWNDMIANVKRYGT